MPRDSRVNIEENDSLSKPKLRKKYNGLHGEQLPLFKILQFFTKLYIYI